MKLKIVLILFIGMCFGKISAQNERNLEETKVYIIESINKYAIVYKNDNRKIKAEFEDNLLKITTHLKSADSKPFATRYYNIKTLYKTKGPIRIPGDRARVLVYVDELTSPKSEKWKKSKWEINFNNYDVGFEFIKAVHHLKDLLRKEESNLERF